VPVENADVQPIRLGEVVRSNLWIIVLMALLGLGLGIAAGTQIEERSTATAKILLTPLEGNPFYPSSRGEQLVNLESEAQALRSTEVATIAKGKLGSELTEAELLDQVEVAVPVNTQILEVTFTAGDDEVAVEGAQAFADSYLEFRTANAQQLIDEQIAELDEQIAAANTQLTTRATELSRLPTNSPEAKVIGEEMTTIASQFATLNAARTDLTTRSTDPGQPVTPAAVQATGPVTPKLLLPIVGLLLGAVLGLLIGLLRSRADDRLRDPADVLDLGVTVIGTVAWNDPSTTARPSEDGAVNEDEYRKLRVAVLAMEKRRPFTLLVAGASAGSTGPLTVVDLSTSFARAGLDTVVVDATSHGAGPATILDPDNETGLAEVLLGEAVLTEALSPVAPLLWVLPPGHEIGGVADLFVGNEMSRLLDAAKDHCDVVIVAADSVQQGVAQSLADMSDAVIVETEQDTTTRSELDRAARALTLLGSTFLGTVFLGRDAAKRTQVFRPHMTVNQRQLPPGPFAVLGSAESTEAPPAETPPADASTAEPSTQDTPSEAGSKGAPSATGSRGAPSAAGSKGAPKRPGSTRSTGTNGNGNTNGNRGPNGSGGTAASTPERSEDPASGQ
jgi:capsular polysaccharide biosynthesis protein/Mrp family chromosome partitioning ATPase